MVEAYTTGLDGIAITRNLDLAMRLAKVQQAFAMPTANSERRLSLQHQLYQRFFSPQLYWFAATRWTDGIGGRFIRRDRAWGQHVGRPPEGAPVLQNAAFLAMEKLAGRWTDYLVVINHEDEAAARAPST